MTILWFSPRHVFCANEVAGLGMPVICKAWLAYARVAEVHMAQRAGEESELSDNCNSRIFFSPSDLQTKNFH